MNSDKDNSSKSFWQILARKVLPVGALGLLGILVLGHYFEEMSSDLTGRYKNYVTILSIVILAVLLIALVSYCSFLMYFHKDR